MGVFSKLKVPHMLLYADLLLLSGDGRNMLSVMLHWSIRVFQHFMGKSLGAVASPAIQCPLKVRIARSAALNRCR